MKVSTRRFSLFAVSVLTLILLASFSQLALAAEQQFLYTAKATAAVNVRSEPSTKAAKLGKLKKGETVTYLGAYEGGWMRVLHNGIEAYVSSEYASVLPTSDDEYRVGVTDENGIKVELILNNSTFSPQDIIYHRAEVSYVGKNSKIKIYGSTDMVLTLIQGDTVITSVSKSDGMDYTLKRNKPMPFNIARSMSFVPGENIKGLRANFMADDFKLPAGKYELETSFVYYLPKSNDSFIVSVSAPIEVTK